MKAILKLFILKQLAKRGMSGYDLMKECEEMLGYKPSAGSIYPLLRKMEEKGWIKGERKGRKVVYSILPKGKKFIEELHTIKEEFYRRMYSHLAATAEIFDDRELRCFVNGEIFRKYPVLVKIIFRIGNMEEKEARKVIEKIYREIK